MQSLIKQIQDLQKTEVNKTVEKRLKQFESFKNKPNEVWFQELCFCILAANSKQKTAETIEKKLGKKLLTMKEPALSKFIRKNKHRFHNNKAKYIVQARKHSKIKDTMKNKSETEARDWIINNVKGLGYKESSHFLRNTGSKNLAILDRHILNVLIEHKIIEKPKTLTKNNYLLIEEKFNNIAKGLGMSPAKLDLFVWYSRTGEVLK